MLAEDISQFVINLAKARASTGRKPLEARYERQ
jgi:hypothetical protein